MNPAPPKDDGFSPGGESVASPGHVVGIDNGDGNDDAHGHGDGHDIGNKFENETPSNGVTSAAHSPADELGVVGKKRKLMSGSRGVANLTPEQLAKKRANDREAQRAIRERTKNTIEALQHKIHELTNLDHMLELQKAQQAREFVERENAEIKRRLMTIMGMLEPLVHAQMEPQPCMPPTSQPYTSTPSIAAVHQSANALSYHSPSTVHSASPAGSLHHQHHQQQQHQHHPHQQHHDIVQASPAWQVSRNDTPIQAHAVGVLDEYTRSQLEQQRHSLQHSFEMGQERLNLNYVLSPDSHSGRPLAGVPKIERGVQGAQDSPAYQHVPMKHDWTQVSQVGHSGEPQMEPSIPSIPSSMAPPMHHHHHHHHPQDYSLNRGMLPPYAIPTNNCAPTCPLDSLLLDCIQERQQRRNEGLDPRRVAGPQYPSVSSLLNPENARFSHPLSKFFTDILAKFPDIAQLPERVAVLYVMFVFMRWQVLLSDDTYAQLPDWMIPRPSQLTKPHPIWIDYLPFPEMRERLVHNYNPDEYAFDNFFVPYTKTLVLSWPYEGTDTLLQDPASDEIMINPVFYRHLRNLDNWKLVGPAFEKTFPKLAGSYNHG